MMNKDKMIQLIENELLQAEEASNETEFEKHMYAIHTLTSLYTTSTKQHTTSYPLASEVSSSVSTQIPSDQSKKQVSAAEIKAMGGKVSQSMQQHKSSPTSLDSNRLTTDDEIGNGESIFDF